MGSLLQSWVLNTYWGDILPSLKDSVNTILTILTDGEAVQHDGADRAASFILSQVFLSYKTCFSQSHFFLSSSTKHVAVLQMSFSLRAFKTFQSMSYQSVLQHTSSSACSRTSGVWSFSQFDKVQRRADQCCLSPGVQNGAFQVNALCVNGICFCLAHWRKRFNNCDRD